LLDVAVQVVDAEARHAGGVAAARRALPELAQLAVLLVRVLGVEALDVEGAPLLVAVAELDVDVPPVGEGPALRALAGELPLFLAPHPLAALAAPALGVLEGAHHEGPLPAEVGRLVLVHAPPDVGGLALLGGDPLPVGEAVALPPVDAEVLLLVEVGA